MSAETRQRPRHSRPLGARHRVDQYPAAVTADAASLRRVFAAGMLPKVEWLRTVAHSARQRSALHGSLNQELRKLCDALGTDGLKPLVSTAAAETASAKDIDLCVQDWHAQARFDPGRGVFHLEHVVPIGSVRARVLASHDLDEILDALEQLRVAWILKSENAELTRLGFRSTRPDPEAAYAEAGIVLRTCHPD